MKQNYLKLWFNCLLMFFTCAGITEIPKQRILCFGDSITRGTYINGRYQTGNSWVNILEERSGGRLKCINAGRSGRQTIQKLELLPVIKKNKDIDHVLFYLGVNDLHSDDATNQKNLQGCISNTEWMISQVRKTYGTDLKVTIISTPGLNLDTVSPRFRNIGFTDKCQQMLEKLGPLYKELASRKNCDFIDLWGVVSPQNYSDGLHPDLKGQTQTAEYIWNSLINNGQPIKIACIGDSITFGAGIKDRNNNSYPAQLQKLIGSKFQVKNFGVSARTLLKRGNYPYWNEKAYKNALAFNPNYVIIKLGTNDSKPVNWQYKGEFTDNLKELVESFLKLPSRPKVFLSTPAPVVTDRWGITQAVVANEVIPSVQSVAKNLKLQVIDFHNAIPAEKRLVPDGVHPNAAGAAYMAEAAYKAILDRKYATADIKLPAIFADHMVLQRNKPIKLWGWAKAGTKIAISLNNAETKTTTPQSGKWHAELPAQQTGGPYTLKFSTATSYTSLKNIMIGEVWICSGQSNMEMPVAGWPRQPIEGSKEAIASANFPNLRLFHLQRKIATAPEEDCVGDWQPCTPKTVDNFSATGFFFGRKLLKELKNVPIGLIMTSWGGTPAEAWTSPDALKRIPEFKSEVERIASIGDNPGLQYAKYKKELDAWYNKLSSTSKGGWTTANFDTSAWETAKLPQKWSKNNSLKNFAGVANFRKEIAIPAEWAGKNLQLELGPIDDMDITYFNGKKVGSINNWNTPRSYKIPARQVKVGKCVIAVSVVNPAGEGGIFGKPAEMKIYPKGKKNAAISLAGAWKFIKGLPTSKFPPQPVDPGRVHYQSPTVLYNGMIAPLVPLSIRGAIWYQGESNSRNAPLYHSIFPNMVKNWREDFNQGDFPFYYVQIAPFRYGPGRDAVGIREIQRESLQLIPNSGMACIMDKTNLRCIHPPQKTEAGERLAYWALAKDYGMKIPYSGPLYRNHKVIGHKISVAFDHAGSGLTSRGKPLNSFEIAGKDGKFYPATAVIEGNNIVVSSGKVPNPVNVRYGWHNAALAELWNKEGLPASSFRTNQ